MQNMQAPAKPKTAYGEMLSYYLKMEPQLFKAAVEDQLKRLKEEKDERDKRRLQISESAESMEKDKAELTLIRQDQRKTHNVESQLLISLCFPPTGGWRRCELQRLQKLWRT